MRGVLYILFFGLGSCIAMGIFSGFLVGSIGRIGEWVDHSGRVFTTSLTIIAFISCFIGYGIIRDSGVF